MGLSLSSRLMRLFKKFFGAASGRNLGGGHGRGPWALMISAIKIPFGDGQ